MLGQQFWIEIDGAVRGPVPLSELRELACSGRVGPNTLISLDKAQWFSARRVNGLFKMPGPESGAGTVPPGEKGSPSDRELPRREPADGHDRPETAGRTAPRFPVIRIRRRFLRFEVVAIYETHVLMGTRFRGSVPVTEEMCHPAGEPALRRLLRWTKRVEFADVSEIREQAPKKPKKSKARLQPDRLCRFTLHSNDRRRLRFSVPLSQAGSVRTVLSSKFADRYLSRTVRRSRLLAGVAMICLSIILIFFLLMAVYAESSVSPVGAAIGVALGLTLCVAGLYAVLASGQWMQGGELPTGTTPQDLPQRKPVLCASRTIRSRWLGWTLKLLGIAYWVVIASPLTDRLQDYIQNNIESAYSQGQIWALIWAPAPLLIYTGYRLCQRRYEPSDRGDTRKPILFLRPFEDDSTTTLQPPGLLSSITGVRSKLPYQWSTAQEAGRTTAGNILMISNPVQLLRMVLDYGVGTSEESLVRYFEKFGPVVAIGKPGEGLATPGASRVYVEDARWKETVRTELTRSQAVIVQPGLSAGVQWELEEIRARVDPYRVLLCLVSYWWNPQAYEDLASLAQENLRLELPRVVPFLTRPSFLYFERGWVPRLQELSYKNPVLWPLTADAADLVYTLHPFVQGIHGGEREMPRPPRWGRGDGKASAKVAALLLALVILFGSMGAIHTVAQYIVGPFVSPSAPQSGPTPPPEQQILDLVARSARITLQGRAVPYQFEIPDAFLKQTSEKAMNEHWWKSPDDRLQVQVIAHDQQEDFSNLAEQCLKSYSGENVLESKLESVRTVELAGVDWVEVRVSAKHKSGVIVRDLWCGTSGPRGTVLVVVEMISSPESDPIYQRVTDEVLQSFRFLERFGPDVNADTARPSS